MINKSFTNKHSPIKEKKELSRFARVKIELNEQGVLCGNGRIRRVLKPGDGLTLGDRLVGELSLYMIDHAPHETIWYVKPISRDEPEVFPFAIKLRYRVLDAQRMVEDDIKDTEAIIVSALTPLLRKEARKYSLYQYEALENMIEDMLEPEVLAKYGLELLYRDVEIEFTEEERNNLKALVRAMNVPQQTLHTHILPTLNDDAKFHATVTVNYKVTDYNRLPTKTLAEAEKWLWSRVLVTLRRESRKYTIDHIANAEQSLQNAVESEIYSDHGLEIVSIQVSLDIESPEKTAEMGAIQDQGAVDRMKATVALAQQDLTQKKEEAAVQFYTSMIEKGQWPLIAKNLVDNKMDAKEVLIFLNEQQRSKLDIEIEKYKLEFDLKKKVVEYALEKGDGLSETTAEKVIEDVVRDEKVDQIKSIPEKSETSES